MPKYKSLTPRIAALVAEELDRLDAARQGGSLTEAEYGRQIGLMEGWLRARGALDVPGWSLLTAAKGRRTRTDDPPTWYRAA